MLDLRRRIFLIISIVVGIILAFLLLYLFVFKKQTPKDDSAENIPVSAEQGGQAGRIALPAGKPAPVFTAPANQEEIYTKQLARMFVERYMSFSNQNENKHIDDVLPLATQRMASWLKKQTIAQSPEYYGTTTKVIASLVKEMGAGKAVVQVDAQQEVQKANSSETVYRSGKVNLVKSGNEWKIDGLYWEE